jgi:hypothetical protein
VHDALLKHFPHLEAVRIYHAETSSITMIHLLVDNVEYGFKRAMFKPTLRSLGTRVLKDQEVTTPWSVSVESYVINNKTLPKFFDDNPDVKPEGCHSARELYYSWKKN